MLHFFLFELELTEALIYFSILICLFIESQEAIKSYLKNLKHLIKNIKEKILKL